MAIRSTVHQTGAATLSELLQVSTRRIVTTSRHSLSLRCVWPSMRECVRDQSWICGGRVGHRSGTEPMLYLCPKCDHGQFPADVQSRYWTRSDFSPRRAPCMLAAVGSELSFAQSRDQIKLLADLEVTAKACERIAESIGEDIEARQQQDIRRAKQLSSFADRVWSADPVLVRANGWDVQTPVVKSEVEGRAGRTPGQLARTRECKLGVVFTQTGVDAKGRPVRDEESTTYVGAIETAELFGLRIYTRVLGTEAGIGPPSE